MRRFACQVTFGSGEDAEACGYEGQPLKALRPRPSRKPVLICPACLSEVR